ncbi:MAG: SDR family oxidoreductase [Nitrospirales bacterium]|nr:SDR family oxidoreductase [Nitrospirales bacterium]
MADRLKGKVGIITGGNSGIGLATAKTFQAEGATVVITGRRKDAVATAVKDIGGSCIGIVSDTGNLNAIQTFYQEVKKKVGTIDILFLNAGVATFGSFASIDEATFDEMVDVNFKGLFFNVQTALPLLSEGASVIFNTSIADQKGFPNTNVYAATKAAVRSLARTLSTELLDQNIRVNAIAPGPIDTPIFEKIGAPQGAISGIKNGFAGENPMKRLGTSDEVAKAVLFLASDDSSYITGIDLTVDGGMTQL